MPAQPVPQDARERARIAGSLAATRAIREATLTLACDEHDAPPGHYCWRKARGLCIQRVHRSFFPAPPRSTAD